MPFRGRLFEPLGLTREDFAKNTEQPASRCHTLGTTKETPTQALAATLVLLLQAGRYKGQGFETLYEMRNLTSFVVVVALLSGGNRQEGEQT